MSTLPSSKALPMSPASLPAPRAVDGSILDKRLALVDLLEVESFREVMASFADLYRVGIKVFDAAGNKLVDIRVGNSQFCGYLWEFGSTRQACTKVVTSLKNDPFSAENGLEKSRTVDCFSGLRYVVMPIVYEGDLMGRFIFGPYMPSTAMGPSEQIYRIEPRAERAVVGRLIDPVRRAPDDLVGKILLQMQKMVEVVIHTSFKQILTSQMHIESVTSTYGDLQAKNSRLEEQNEKLKEVERLKGNFLAMVSHELRTPLTSVIGYSEMLLEGIAGSLNEEQRDYVKTIMDKGESLLSLITQILDLSRIEAGSLRLQASEFDPRPVAQSATTSIVPQAAKKKIELSVNLAPSLPFLRADKEKLLQVMTNLLGNAVKFTPTGGRITLDVDVWTGPRSERPPASSPFELGDETFLRIVVSDTGVGIPPDKTKAIFDRFFQIDNSSTREFGGTGLGLSIVKSFVDAHRGEIHVESAVGKGSRFTVLWPLTCT